MNTDQTFMSSALIGGERVLGGGVRVLTGSGTEHLLSEYVHVKLDASPAGGSKHNVKFPEKNNTLKKYLYTWWYYVYCQSYCLNSSC